MTYILARRNAKRGWGFFLDVHDFGAKIINSLLLSKKVAIVLALHRMTIVNGREHTAMHTDFGITWGFVQRQLAFPLPKVVVVYWSIPDEEPPFSVTFNGDRSSTVVFNFVTLGSTEKEAIESGKQIEERLGKPIKMIASADEGAGVTSVLASYRRRRSCAIPGTSLKAPSP